MAMNMSARGSFLNERTLLPVSLVITLLAFSAWLSSVAVRASVTEDRLDGHLATVEGRAEDRERVLLDIQRRLERIDTKVDFIYENFNSRPVRR